MLASCLFLQYAQQTSPQAISSIDGHVVDSLKIGYLYASVNSPTRTLPIYELQKHHCCIEHVSDIRTSLQNDGSFTYVGFYRPECYGHIACLWSSQALDMTLRSLIFALLIVVQDHCAMDAPVDRGRRTLTSSFMKPLALAFEHG